MIYEDLTECSSVSLGQGRVGLSGVVAAIDTSQCPGQVESDLERMLLEIGLIEGTSVEITHEGPFGRDPIAVRVGNMRVALRRREACAVQIYLNEEN